MFIVPEQFNRNAPNVQALAPAADTGKWLLQYMCDRIGIADLSHSDVLDFGCGTRFADSILNRNVPIRSYVGIDVFKPMVDFLRDNALDSRLEFHHLDMRNPFYNPQGVQLAPDTGLPVGDRLFDVACMFSVITHQQPEDAHAIFSVLRRYTRPSGRMFFSVYFDEGDFGYKERFPEEPTRSSVYTPDLVADLLSKSGWRIVSTAPPGDRNMPIMDSILCVPA